MTKGNGQVTIKMFKAHVEKARQELYFLNLDDEFFENGDWPNGYNRWRDTNFDTYLRHLRDDRMSLQVTFVHLLFARKLVVLKHQYSLELAMFSRDQLSAEQRKELQQKLVQP